MWALTTRRGWRPRRTEEERLAPYRRVRDEIREFVLGLPESLQKQDTANQGAMAQ